MATQPTPQRAWRAACPNCGAPVDFASAASASAVCSFCRSTLVREGDALRRIGSSAELFDDHTPLQLGAAGSHQGLAFTLVGRLQYGYGTQAPAAHFPEGVAGPAGQAGSELDGTWNEWHALFDNGRRGWLSEDNGAYVFAFDAPLPADAPADAPALAALRAGQSLRVDGRAWNVASVVRARLLAAEGELPSPPRLDGAFTVADLRNPQGDVATLDGSDPQRAHWSVGRSVALSALALSGLRDGGATTEATLGSRSLACPSCGAALVVTLASTMAISCHQCQAVVDVSSGVGAELKHYAQNNSGVGGLKPQIPLGSTGTLALGGAELPWQVVGYQERCDLPEGGDDEDGDEDEGEQTFWREYLLYNRHEGFAFLVDAEDGWSWVKPITGVPEQRGITVRWASANFRKRYAYRAKVTWVQGEFYWRVRRGEVAQVTDYDGVGAAREQRLSCEKTAGEVTWSAGAVLPATQVADAFRIAPGARTALQRDAAPLAAGSFVATGQNTRKGLMLFVGALFLMAMLSRCGGNDCDELRSTFGEASAEYQQCVRNRGSGGGGSSGGSYGGYSSGGGHK